jgi:hypothetical protein
VGGFDSDPPRYILAPVIRLLIAALCALGVAFSPLTASGAIAAPSAMAGCAMDEHMPAGGANHSKKDCCAAACQMTAAALQPERTADTAPLQANGALHGRPCVKALASFTASGLDPPPRLTS